MKRTFFLLFMLYFSILSCGRQEYIKLNTILAIESSEPLDKNKLTELKENLENRLKDVNIEVDQIAINPNRKQVSIIAEMGLVDKAFYHSLFKSSKLDLWHTFRTTDDPISNIEADRLQVDHFIPYTELALRAYPQEVLGICKEADKLMEVLAQLENQLNDVPNLKLIWSNDKESPDLSAYQLYMIDTKGNSSAPLTEQTLMEAEARLDEYTNSFSIGLKFSNEGARVWGDMTITAASNNNRSIALVLNERVRSCPRVINPITTGDSMVTGNFTEREAQEIAQEIRIGRLPYNLKIIEEKIITGKE